VVIAMRISSQALKEVEAALEQYHRDVAQAGLAQTTAKTYLTHADDFVRWLKDDFVPGIRKK